MLQHAVELGLGFLAVIALLVTLARRLQLPYPVLLVAGGLILGFVPGLPRVRMAPEIVFLLFLPPLLYAESFYVSWRDLRANFRPISLLAFGLVLATTSAVAAIAHWAIPALSWPIAFVLGAVVAPTDEAAVMPVIERLGVPQRIATIISDESLLNDAVSLVIYRLAVAAVATGALSLARAGVQFLLVSVGGVAIGLLAGWLITPVLRRLNDPPVEITLSLLIPYLAYLPAERVGASGVLAVVALGIFLGRQSSLVRTPRTRVEARAFWQMLVFLLNGILFLLVGLQLREAVNALSGIALPVVIGNALLISLTCVLVRVAWVFVVLHLPRVLRARRRRERAPRWGHAAIIAWTGVRGGLSLAAALAIPLALGNGAPFPERQRIIFMTFSVILVTLVLQGLSLPGLIHRLRLKGDRSQQREENEARLKAAEAALTRLETLGAENWVPPEVADHLREHYATRLRLYKGRAGGEAASPHEARTAAYHRLQRELLEAEHEMVVRLRDEGAISDDVLHTIERELDLERIRLGPEAPGEET